MHQSVLLSPQQSDIDIVTSKQRSYTFKQAELGRVRLALFFFAF
jgi:hypothetical protein